MQVRVFVVDPTGTSVRGVLFELDTTTALASELATTLTNRKIPFTGPATLTPFTTQPGDRLVVELGYRTENSTATAYSHSLNTGEPSIASELPEDETTTTTTIDAWVEFSQDLIIFDGEGAGSDSGTVGLHLNVKNVGGSGLTQDLIAPNITAPSPGAGAISFTQAISCQITDESSLKKYLVLIKFSSIPRYDVVWDGYDWDDLYEPTSSREVITGGYGVSIARQGGWPSSFDFVVIAWDGGGNTTQSITSYTVSSYAPSIGPITVT